MNFGKTLLDEPVKRKRTVRDNKFYLVLLPETLKPTPYAPPKPVPKPRIKKQAPIALPRNILPKKVREKVQKLIDEITPYYSSVAIRQFKGTLKYLVAKLHGCYPKAISLPVSQNIFARFFSAPARRQLKSQVTVFLLRCNNTRKTFCFTFY